MPTGPIPARHAMLFELLRQENRARAAAVRLRLRRRPDPGHDAALLVRALAARSWAVPGQGRS